MRRRDGETGCRRGWSCWRSPVCCSTNDAETTACARPDSSDLSGAWSAPQLEPSAVGGPSYRVGSRKTAFLQSGRSYCHGALYQQQSLHRASSGQSLPFRSRRRAKSPAPPVKMGAATRALLLLVSWIPLVAPEFGTITNTVYDCQYDLTQTQCLTCQGTATLNLAFYDPKPSNCIYSTDGCCKSTEGYEYFRKSSLANYGVGDTVQYFFPGTSGDTIRYVLRNEDIPNIEFITTAPGKCVLTSDFQVDLARCKILPPPPPNPPVPPSPPPLPSTPPCPPPSPPPPTAPPPPPPPIGPPQSPPSCDSRLWSGYAYVNVTEATHNTSAVIQRTHIYFRDCCSIAETHYGDGGVVQNLGYFWCNMFHAQDQYGNKAADYW